MTDTPEQQAEREAFERAMREAGYTLKPQVFSGSLRHIFQAGVRYGLEMRGCCTMHQGGRGE